MRAMAARALLCALPDRKSTRLNSSHLVISYAVFCLKKKKVLLRFSRDEWRITASPHQLRRQCAVCPPLQGLRQSSCCAPYIARLFFFFFFFNDTATTEIYTLSLHDALPISPPVTKRSAAAVAPSS